MKSLDRPGRLKLLEELEVLAERERSDAGDRADLGSFSEIFEQLFGDNRAKKNLGGFNLDDLDAWRAFTKTSEFLKWLTKMREVYDVKDASPRSV